MVIIYRIGEYKFRLEHLDPVNQYSVSPIMPDQELDNGFDIPIRMERIQNGDWKFQRRTDDYSELPAWAVKFESLFSEKIIKEENSLKEGL